MQGLSALLAPSGKELLMVTAQEKLLLLLPRNDWCKMILQHGLKLDSCDCLRGLLHIKEYQN